MPRHQNPSRFGVYLMSVTLIPTYPLNVQTTSSGLGWVIFVQDPTWEIYPETCCTSTLERCTSGERGGVLGVQIDWRRGSGSGTESQSRV